MGVRINPGAAAWSYGGFNRFRTRLAAEEGIVLDEMSGYGGDGEWSTSNGQHVTPLAPLLNHSDCEGFLRPETSPASASPTATRSATAASCAHDRPHRPRDHRHSPDRPRG